MLSKVAQFSKGHDNLDKELQRDIWKTLGLPKPTIQVDTGGKSIHTKYALSTPCSVEQWRELQADLLERITLSLEALQFKVS